MAFGTFFKKILTGAKNLAPVIRKGLDTVSKYAPIIADTANKFGPIGSTIGGIVSTAGSLAGHAGEFMDRVDSTVSKYKLGSRKFDQPILKYTVN